MDLTGVCSCTELFFLTLHITAKSGVLFVGLQAVGCQVPRQKG